MLIDVTETLGEQIKAAASADDLLEALLRSSHDLGFDHFALALEVGLGGEAGISVLIHNYPDSWADVYVGFNLGASDPIRRAAEHSLLGFRWDTVSTLIPVSDAEQTMFETGRRHGIADGYTVPRHLPGELTGSCSFVTSGACTLPASMLFAAELLGALAIASAHRMTGWVQPADRPKLTDRQRDCVLWAARGKTDWEISRILGISRDTVSTHLKEARERCDTRNRASLVLIALFDGLISFADIFRWRETH